MKTDDRDERLASILDGAVDEIGLGAREAPVTVSRGIGRATRAIAAVATAAVFVAGAVFASGRFGLEDRPREDGSGTVVEGSLGSDKWQLERPSEWFTSPFEGCETTLPRGLVVSNVEFEFLNPQGQIPSCNERMVFAGFPDDGVAIDLEPEGVRWRSSPVPFSDTPFPIRPSQLVKTSGISGGPQEFINLVAVKGEPIAMVRMWVGPDASSGDVEAVHRILDSMRIEDADRWVDEVFGFRGYPLGESRAVEVGVTRPEAWGVEAYGRPRLSIFRIRSWCSPPPSRAATSSRPAVPCPSSYRVRHRDYRRREWRSPFQTRANRGATPSRAREGMCSIPARPPPTVSSTAGARRSAGSSGPSR